MKSIFKAQSAIGTFKYINTAEAGELRQKIEKFVLHNPVSQASWEDYCELRSIRELGRSIVTEEDAQIYDILWDEFCNSVDSNGSSKFAMALIVERSVLKVQPWA